ncbi:hypothetical protein BDZ89DRAFT_1133469 [Hymenopellis radicata]|nr:hypothetical protein BDZ89DRAFT_1133469 [Hymenopellis radicata]
MPVLPSPAQVGLREPPEPWGSVYKNSLRNFFGRGWLATYSREQNDLIGLPRPVKIHGNYSASEIGADRMNDFLPYNIFCVHAAVPTNDLEECRVKVHLNRQINGMVVDVLSPSTHLCAYTIVLKNAMKKQYADLFIGTGNSKKLIIPVINYTDPLVSAHLENPYRALLGVPRANPGFDYQNEFIDHPLRPPHPMPAPPPPPPSHSVPARSHRSAPARLSRSASAHPSRSAPAHPSHSTSVHPSRSGQGPLSARTDTDIVNDYLNLLSRRNRPLGAEGTLSAFVDEDDADIVSSSQKRKLEKEYDDEVEVTWQGRVEPRGDKPTPIDADSFPSPPRRRRQHSPAISGSQALSQVQKNSKIISVIPLGNRANDLDMLSAKQVAAGKAVDHTLIKATEALFDAGHFTTNPQSHPGHPDTTHVFMDPYRTTSAENISGYFDERPANVALRQLTSIIGLHVEALQGLFRSSATCPSCLRFFEGDAMLKHFVTTNGTRACAHGGSLTPVSTTHITSRAQLHIPPALLIVPKEHANTFNTSIEFPDDALTVAWALWASYIGVPEDLRLIL